MSLRALLVALVVGVLLVGYVAWELTKDLGGEAGLTLGEPVLLTPRGQIGTLEIVRQGGLRASFRRGDRGWVLEEGPPETDTGRVPDVIHTWSLVMLTGKVEDAAGPGAYGLDPPVLSMRAVSQAGETTTTEIGNMAPVGAQFYARLGGSEVFLLDPGASNVIAEVDVLLGLAAGLSPTAGATAPR